MDFDIDVAAFAEVALECVAVTVCAPAPVSDHVPAPKSDFMAVRLFALVQKLNLLCVLMSDQVPMAVHVPRTVPVSLSAPEVVAEFVAVVWWTSVTAVAVFFQHGGLSFGLLQPVVPILFLLVCQATSNRLFYCNMDHFYVAVPFCSFDYYEFCIVTLVMIYACITNKYTCSAYVSTVDRKSSSDKETGAGGARLSIRVEINWRDLFGCVMCCLVYIIH